MFDIVGGSLLRDGVRHSTAWGGPELTYKPMLFSHCWASPTSASRMLGFQLRCFCWIMYFNPHYFILFLIKDLGMYRKRNFPPGKYHGPHCFTLMTPPDDQQGMFHVNKTEGSHSGKDI